MSSFFAAKRDSHRSRGSSPAGTTDETADILVSLTLLDGGNIEDDEYPMLNPLSMEGQSGSNCFSGPPLSAGGSRETGGLKSNVDKLETEVKKLTKDIKEKAGLDALNKLDTKVNCLNPGTCTWHQRGSTRQA